MNHTPAYSSAPDPVRSGQAASGADGNPPDLDAAVPLLKSSDLQRLNRRALMFLAGIVVLLIVAAVWLFRSAAADDGPAARKAEEEIRIPELPKAEAVETLPPLPPTMAAQPIPLATPDPVLPMPALPGPLPPPPEALSPPPGPSLMERRMVSDTAVTPASPGLPGMDPPEVYARQMLGLADGQRTPEKREDPALAQPLTATDTLLARGTYIRCVMETRLVSELPGFASCAVTEPVYSINGRRLLLPRGSKLSGTYRSEDVSGPRISVVWDRITTPEGLDVRMASPGVDALGSAGHPGDLDGHWPSRIGSALLISLMGDAFKYAGAKHGPQGTTLTPSGNEYIQPYESITARSMERLANQALEKSASRPATVSIHQGTVVNVYVAKDVDFSPVLR